MNRIRIVALAVVLLAVLAGCSLGPRPAPPPPDISREKAIRGLDHFDNGRLDRAERDFKSAFYLDQAEDRPDALARDYQNLAALAIQQGDLATAREYLRRAVAIQRELDEPAAAARALAALGAVEEADGRGEEAARLIEQALGLAPEGAARLYVLNVKGAHLLEAGDVSRAEAVLREALRLGQAEGVDERLRAATRHYLGRAALARGELAAARTLLREAHELDRRGRYPAGIAADFHQLAKVAQAAGNHKEALLLYERAFNIYVYLKDSGRAAVVLADLEAMGGEGSLAGKLARLRQALTGLEAPPTAPAVNDYSLGSRSTTQ